MTQFADTLTFQEVSRLEYKEAFCAMRMNMRKMSDHQVGTITAVKVGGDLGRRIRDMGLVPGTEIRIRGRAPLYDPVALRVRGATLTLRNNEADFIEVEVSE